MRRFYYHGTDADAAREILRRGFSLADEKWGRGWGDGVYLSGTPAFASQWGEIVVVCRLESGTRLLWHRSSDPAVLDSLRREFGKDVLKPAFWKAIPQGKSLTRKEAVNVWHDLIARRYESPRRFRRAAFQELAAEYPRIYEELRRHGYQGVGFRPDSDWPEMLVFNPAHVVVRSVHAAPGVGRLGPELGSVELTRLARRVRRSNRSRAGSD